MLEILEKLGVFTIAGAFITSIFMYFINKRSKAYELELQYKSDEYKHKLELSLEVHRSELNLLFEKASKLHDRRLTLISKLYKHLVNLEHAMLVMTQEWKMVTGDKEVDEKREQERIEKAGATYDKFSKTYSENKIFFNPETCALLDKIRTEFYDSHWDYTFKLRMGYISNSFDWSLAKKAAEGIRQNVPPVLKLLEQDFRNTLAV